MREEIRFRQRVILPRVVEGRRDPSKREARLLFPTHDLAGAVFWKTQRDLSEVAILDTALVPMMRLQRVAR